MTVQDIITDVLRREGGVKYFNVPGDRGGPTKAGITLARLRSERGPHITAEHVKALTESEIRKIYEDAYYWRPRINRLPDYIEHVVMDYYVTSGGWAIKSLQRMLNKFGYKCDIDGAIGPQTVRLMYDLCARVPAHVVVNAYCEERARFYRAIVASDASQAKFIKGWLNRAYSFTIKENQNVAENSAHQPHQAAA